MKLKPVLAAFVICIFLSSCCANYLVSNTSKEDLKKIENHAIANPAASESATE